MKVGIYTIHAIYNYGAMLQAFATQKAISDLGFDVEIVNYYPKSVERMNKYKCNLTNIKNLIRFLLSLCSPSMNKKFKRFNDFHNSMNLSKRLFNHHELFKLSTIYDIHLVGSDQVWNFDNGISNDSLYLLNFLQPNSKKISYASSFGLDRTDIDIPIVLRNCLLDFSKILVREDNAVQLLKRSGIDSVQVLDPTFLLNSNIWSELAGTKRLIKNDYIFAYGFGEKNESNQIIEKVRNILNLPVVGTSISMTSPHKYDKFFKDAGPIEFLNLIKYSKFVVTASYHGAAFAIHFKKNFYVLKHNSRNSRLESMLNLLGLSDRLITADYEFKFERFCIDFNEIIEKIEFETKISKDLLLNSLINC